MKRILTLALGSMLAMMPAFAAESEAPMITFKTNIYGYTGAANSFHIVVGTTEPTYIDVDCGYGPVEYEVTPATYDAESGGVQGTAISMQASSEGIVKIYGDPSLLDYFDAEGCYIDWIELGDCINLDVLDLQHNELKRLDLSKYTKLSAIYLTDNTFTAETPLVVGDNHPNLTILEVDIVDYISPDFDITTFPELMSFDAYANKSLYHLDPTKCPKLVRLSVDSCPLKSLDVTKNPDLRVLNIEDSGITEIDLSGNPLLQQLYATHQSGTLNINSKIRNIDLSHNPELLYLTIGGNRLTSLDVSKNTKLQWLAAPENMLTAIDIENCPDISVLNLRYNNMGFSTLPMPRGTFGEYNYEQNTMPAERSYVVGSEIDFSDKILRDGTSTDCVLYAYDMTSNESTPLDASYFSYADGKVRLLKAYRDSLYLSFGNTAFPEAKLTTARFMVKNSADAGKPSEALRFVTSVSEGTPLSFGVGMYGATAASPRKFYVDFGNGELVEQTATSEGIPAAVNVNGTRTGSASVVVYIPEGDDLSAFSAAGIAMNSVSLDKAVRIRELRLSNAGLYDVDLSYNRDLRMLDLSGNNLRTLSLEGVNGLFGKNLLSDINLSHNALTDVTLNDTRAIKSLNLSNNRISEFTYKDFDNLENFDISHNSVDRLDMTYFTSTKNVNLSYNNFAEITLPATNVFETLNVSNNLLTLATLPLSPSATVNYIYAPQADIVLPAKAPGVNLSAQNRMVNGTGTTYTWLKADGSPVAAGDVETTDGRARFVNPDAGKIYCVMTNPAFPQFGGTTPFRTTVVETAGMPTNVVATFTTVNSGEAVSLSMAAEKEGTAVYIDWSGEGYSLEHYQLATTYTLFSATTQAGANVKVYTYDKDDVITVFSMGGAKLSAFDGSRLTKLICLGVNGAGLSEITLPESDRLIELYLDNNEFTDFDLSRYPNLSMVSLSSNGLTSLDLTKSPALQYVGAGHNEISEVKLDNKALWFLDLADNKLSEIDLSKAPELSQLSLSYNEFEKLDISPAKKLVQLLVDHNRLTFATLPPDDKSLVQYVYSDQANLDVTCTGGQVDLSSQAKVGDVATNYAWYIGTPVFDEAGMLSGEQLYVDDEYTLVDGVTAFLSDFEDLVCVMTNSALDKLYLFTNPLDVTLGISDAVSGDDGIRVKAVGRDVYVEAAGMADGTPVGYVALDGRTVASAVIAEGKAVLRNLPGGPGVIAVGNRGYKVALK